MGRLAFDEILRNDPRYAMVGIDDLLVANLREAIAGRASNDELEQLNCGDVTLKAKTDAIVKLVHYKL